MFAALVAALVVPVGYALSVESMPVSTQARQTAIVSAAPRGVPAAAVVASPIAIRSDADRDTSIIHPVSDAAKLLGIGTVLFGLAAVVRKAI
jgi:hypothetical protein